MATNPAFPQPDTIEPQSPSEVPPGSTPSEAPYSEPPGFAPLPPDTDAPDRSTPEALPPLD